MIRCFRCALALLVMLVSSAKTVSGQPDRGINQFVEVPGARLFVSTAGTGTALLIVHGGPGLSHDYLAPELIDLLANEYRLIFYDQRASGRSTGVADTTRLTMDEFVADLERVRESLGLGKVNLLGHSFGGLLAMYYASAYPDGVSKMILLDTAPASWELSFPYFRKAIAERQTESDREELKIIGETPNFETNPALMERFMKIYFRPFFHDPDLAGKLSLGITDQWLANSNVTNDRIWKDLGRYDIHDRLVQITAPTLIIHGAESVISVDGANAIANQISDSQLIVFENVGHFPHIEAPQEFKAAVKAFLK